MPSSAAWTRPGDEVFPNLFPRPNNVSPCICFRHVKTRLLFTPIMLNVAVRQDIQASTIYISKHFQWLVVGFKK